MREYQKFAATSNTQSERKAWTEPKLTDLGQRAGDVLSDPPGVGFDGGVGPNDYVS